MIFVLHDEMFPPYLWKNYCQIFRKPKKASSRVGASDKGGKGSKAKMEGELLIDFGGSKQQQEKKEDGWANSWDDEAWESLNKDD